MPRQTRSQTTIRTGAPEELRKPAAQVTARQPYIRNSRIGADRSAGQSELRMARALAGFGDVMGDIGRRHAQQQAARDLAAGQAQAQRDSLEGVENFIEKRREYLEGKSGRWIEGYNAQAGRLTGYQLLESIQQQVAENPDMTQEQFDSLWADGAKALLKGMDPESDSIFSNHATSVLAQGEENLRKRYNAHQTKKAHQATFNDYDSLVRNDLKLLTEMENATPEQYHSLIESHRQQAEDLGLTRREASEVIVDNVIEMAKATGNAGLLDLLDADYTDLTNPEGKAPKLSEQAKYGRRIDAAREAIETGNMRRDSKEYQKRIFEFNEKFVELSSRGEVAEAMEFIEHGLENQLITGREAARLAEQLRRGEAEERVISSLYEPVANGEAWMLPEADRKKVLEHRAGELIADATDLEGNPNVEAMVNANQMIAKANIKNGVMTEQHKDTLTGAPLNSPEGFAAAYDIYRHYKAEDPGYVARTVPNGRQVDAKFRYYEALIRSGKSHEDALLAMQESYTPERLKAADDAIKNDTYVNENIERNLVDAYREGGDSWGAVDATNGDYVVSTVRQNMRMLLAENPGMDIITARTTAEAQFEGNHVRVYTKDRSSFTWNYRGKLNVPLDFEEAQQWMSDQMVDNMAGSDQAASHYYFAPNPLVTGDPEWILMNGDTGKKAYRFDEEGNAYPIKMRPDQLSTAYQATEEAKAGARSRKHIEEEGKRDRRPAHEKSLERDSGYMFLFGVSEEEKPFSIDEMIDFNLNESTNQEGDRPFATLEKALKRPKRDEDTQRVPLYFRHNDG